MDGIGGGMGVGLHRHFGVGVRFSPRERSLGTRAKDRGLQAVTRLAPDNSGLRGRTPIGTVTCLMLAAAVCGAVPASAFEGAPARVTPVWREVAPGVWKTTIGKPEPFTLLGAAGARPAPAALKNLPAGSFPIEQEEVEGRRWDAKTAVRLPLAEGEDIYGFGVDFNSVRRNGAVFELHVDHWNTRAPSGGRTHAPVPLYVSSRGFAVLFDAARYLKVTVGHGVRLAAKHKPPVIDRTTNRVWQPSPAAVPAQMRWQANPVSDSIEVLANAPGIEVYVFAGPTPLDAVRRYNLFCGGGALPPKWGLGFLNRVRADYTADQVLADVAEFRRRGIPLDVIGLEPGWMSHSYPCSFEWDPNRFPDPEAFLAAARKQNVRLNLWFNPYVGPPSAPLYRRLLQFAGTHLVWNGIVPDYSLPAAREAFVQHLRGRVMAPNPDAIGGFKVDEVDGYDSWLWPETAVFPSGRDAEQMRQTYGLLLQRALDDLFRSLNRRTMGQVRGTNAGASRFPFVIYNDNYEFGPYITALGNSGFAGVLWSPEVRGSDSGEDMLRRIQAVCFSPLALYNGWASRQRLWTHEEVAEHIRAAIRLRLRLLPYLYNAFAQYHHQGAPVIRPMQLAAIGGGSAGTAGISAAVPAAVRDVRDQFLFGESLLVAPIAPGAKTRTVILPGGRWYDFYTGRLAGDGPTIEVSPPLSQIPLFVRDGALIPMMVGEHERVPSGRESVELEVRHYGTLPGRLRFYDDDGTTMDFERGAFSWTILAAERDSGGAWRGSVTPERGGRTWSYSSVSWSFMTPQ